MPELYLPPIRSKKFHKGMIPFNKGKKWDDFMPEEHREKILKNLVRTGRADIGGWNKKPIIGVKNGKFYPFSSSFEASSKLNITARNIRKCANGERKTAGGIHWFFETDKRWIEELNKQQNDSNT